MISIHAPREGGDATFFPGRGLSGAISIHAPREGGDVRRPSRRRGPLPISIHAPREGGDAADGGDQGGAGIFQSTPLARGATGTWREPDMHDLFQSTPLARGATVELAQLSRPQQFQSTPLARGATASDCVEERAFDISIHAPREGGD